MIQQKCSNMRILTILTPILMMLTPLEEGRAFKEQSLFACKQAAA